MPSPSFESLRVWHSARHLTVRIYEVTRSGSFAKDYGLRDQIRRASVSIMSNIAEGHERGGTKEFIHFLRIAKGSAGEVRSQLYAAQDVGYLQQEVAAQLRTRVAGLTREISALVERLKANSALGAQVSQAAGER